MVRNAEPNKNQDVHVEKSTAVTLTTHIPNETNIVSEMDHHKINVHSPSDAQVVSNKTSKQSLSGRL